MFNLKLRSRFKKKIEECYFTQSVILKTLLSFAAVK